MRPSTVDAERFLASLDPARWKREKVDIAGTLLPGAVLQGHEGRAGIMVAAVHSSEPRFLSCFVDRAVANANAACANALAVFTAESVLSQIAFSSATLQVGEQHLRVPEGCSVSNGDRISCATAELHWRNPGLNCSATPAEFRKSFENLLASVGKFSHSTQFCVVMGKPLTCDRYVLTPPDKAATTIVAVIDGCAQPSVQCNLLTSPGTEFPEPCDQVFFGQP